MKKKHKKVLRRAGDLILLSIALGYVFSAILIGSLDILRLLMG